MPMDRKRYPPDWKRIATEIKEAAGWKCPHCGKRNRMGKYKEEEFIEFGKTMQHCDRCSYVHLWKLELSEGFKKKVIDMLLTGGSG